MERKVVAALEEALRDVSREKSKALDEWLEGVEGDALVTKAYLEIANHNGNNCESRITEALEHVDYAVEKIAHMRQYLHAKK